MYKPTNVKVGDVLFISFNSGIKGPGEKAEKGYVTSTTVEKIENGYIHVFKIRDNQKYHYQFKVEDKFPLFEKENKLMKKGIYHRVLTNKSDYLLPLVGLTKHGIPEVVKTKEEDKNVFQQTRISENQNEEMTVKDFFNKMKDAFSSESV